MKAKLITVKDVLAKKPCSEWTEDRLKEVLGEGKTLLQILNLKDVEPADRIWCVTRFLDDDTNRAFAIWCARQCKTDGEEIKDFIDVIERYYAGKATKEELSAVNNAICWVEHRAANNAPDWAAYTVAERKKQIAKLSELVGEKEKQ